MVIGSLGSICPASATRILFMPPKAKPTASEARLAREQLREMVLGLHLGGSLSIAQIAGKCGTSKSTAQSIIKTFAGRTSAAAKKPPGLCVHCRRWWGPHPVKVNAWTLSVLHSDHVCQPLQTCPAGVLRELQQVGAWEGQGKGGCGEAPAVRPLWEGP